MNQKELQAQRKQQQEEQRKQLLELAEKRKAAGACPLAFVTDIDPLCKVEKCALYSEGGCILAKMAESSANKTTGKRCPIKGRNCIEACALNVDGGCIEAG